MTNHGTDRERLLAGWHLLSSTDAGKVTWERGAPHRTDSLTPGWESKRDYIRADGLVGNEQLILRPVNNANALTWERL